MYRDLYEENGYIELIPLVHKAMENGNYGNYMTSMRNVVMFLGYAQGWDTLKATSEQWGLHPSTISKIFTRLAERTLQYEDQILAGDETLDILV